MKNVWTDSQGTIHNPSPGSSRSFFSRPVRRVSLVSATSADCARTELRVRFRTNTFNFEDYNTRSGSKVLPCSGSPAFGFPRAGLTRPGGCALPGLQARSLPAAAGMAAGPGPVRRAWSSPDMPLTARRIRFARNRVPRIAGTASMEVYDRRPWWPTRVSLSTMLRGIALILFTSINLPALFGQARLTLLTAFDRPPAPSVIRWMEQEANELFAEAGLSLSWQQNSRVSLPHEATLPVSVQFHGDCRLEFVALALATDGALASTRVSDGEIQPFVQVDCARTAAIVWQYRGTAPPGLMNRARSAAPWAGSWRTSCTTT
jgi:hypothetical protein